MENELYRIFGTNVSNKERHAVSSKEDGILCRTTERSQTSLGKIEGGTNMRTILIDSSNRDAPKIYAMVLQFLETKAVEEQLNVTVSLSDTWEKE